MIITALLVAVAGGVGAVARFVLDGIINQRLRSVASRGTTSSATGLSRGVRGVVPPARLTRVLPPAGFPLGTMIINLSGSLLLGFLAGLVSGGLPPVLQTVVGTGFLGGYTTFSTASVESVRLLQERRYAAAASNALLTVVLAIILALLGFLLGDAIG